VGILSWIVVGLSRIGGWMTAGPRPTQGELARPVEPERSACSKP